MSRFSRSLSAEFRKTTATRLWWILGLVLAGYSAMMAAACAFLLDSMADQLGAGALDAQGVADAVYSSVTAFGYVVPLLIGALAATGEIRHGTLALAFIAEPRRWIVLLGKSCVLVLLGAVLGAIGLAGSVGVGAPTLAGIGAETMLGAGQTWALFGRAILATAIWAVLGFGIGILVRSQAFAIVLALVFTQFLEPVLRTAAAFWDWSAEIARFLPGAASDALVGASAMSLAAQSSVESLPVWAGGVVLAAYALAAVLGGWALRWR